MQFEEMDFLTPKASKLIHQSNLDFSLQSTIAASTDTIDLSSLFSWTIHIQGKAEENTMPAGSL